MLENTFLITLRQILARRGKDAPVKSGFAIYLFGSSLSGKLTSDVDLLVVYERGVPLAAASQVRAWLAETITCDLGRKADICLLSSVEEAEVDFIKTEGAALLLNVFNSE